jgi:phospholipid/cholesterol/gamma-HCH transport system substrate-binding protein
MPNTNPSEAGMSTKVRVGLFSVFGILLLGAVTVFVNDRPFWWRPCNLVQISVEDATGLKMKSPVKSLGLQIGYLTSVELSETRVRLGICVTAPVELLPETRAYLRADGFLGDKFVELKPVRNMGGERDSQSVPEPKASSGGGRGTSSIQNATVPERGTEELPFQKALREGQESTLTPIPPNKPSAWIRVWRIVMPEAFADLPQGAPPAVIPVESKIKTKNPVGNGGSVQGSREIPVGEQAQDVQHLVGQVDSLVGEMTSLTNNLKQTINPIELRETIQKLNKTLENASKTLSPEGGLNTTAQRTLAKLEDSIEQLRDIMTRVNRGEGSVGMLLNDPVYAQEIREVIRNVNRLLGKASGFRFNINLGTQSLPAYEGSRGFFQVTLHPEATRYYLLGIALDPRGSRTITTTSTDVAGVSTTEVETKVVQGTGGSLQFTAMIGKVFIDRLDLSAGAWSGDGTVSAALRLGLNGAEEMLVLRSDLYSSGSSDAGLDYRGTVLFRPLYHSKTFNGVTLQGGVESVHRIEGTIPYFVGANLTFDDENIKSLIGLLL